MLVSLKIERHIMFHKALKLEREQIIISILNNACYTFSQLHYCSFLVFFTKTKSRSYFVHQLRDFTLHACGKNLEYRVLELVSVLK